MPISLPKSTSTTKDGFLAFSFFFTEITVPILISTLSKSLYIKFMKEQITYEDFDKVDIRLGTIISVRKNEKARKPSLVVEVDFGEKIGIKQSSAQITHYYNEENLKGKQVIGVCNFAEKNIAGVVSQVLILGAIDAEGRVTLVHPSQEAENGLPIA